ncbi:hypothetical protein DSECCO2_656210 [anaerobic digester metagenome]
MNINPGFLQNLLHILDNACVLELHHREVDRHGQPLLACLLEGNQLPAGLLEYKHTYRTNETRLLSQRNERQRLDQSIFRIVPPHKRFKATNLLRFSTHLRLIHDKQFIPIKSTIKTVGKAQPPSCLCLHFFVAEHHLVLALCFCAVHGDVCIHDQGMGISSIGGMDGDTYACRQEVLFLLEYNWVLERLHDGVGHQ